uniref:Uncharacterized protein n=1 Tax=Oryza sativa subsp. japonica TaxID=39947 RepID=Q67WF2_ORYSJ|nr:hypothetical protein [Oryza sativa Japonica Group]
MERGGPCDGLGRFRIHLGTRGDCPLPAGDGVKPELYTSDQSKTIRIAVLVVMGGRPDSP